MFTVKNSIYNSIKRIWLRRLFLLVIIRNKCPSVKIKVPIKHRLVINVNLNANKIPLAISNDNINSE